jgi:RNA polymerase sigma-70 factor (family 1)
MTYSKNTDHELTGMVKAGSHAAYTELFNRYWKKLLAIAYNHTRDKPSAEEAVQVVFIAFWDNRGKIEIQLLERYLATAVKFAVFNTHYRRQKRNEALVNRMPFEDRYEMENEIMARFLKEQIDEIVSDLPEKCQLVFRFSRESGLKNHEIAKEMGISEKTVEAHIGKALKVIKGNLPDTGVLLVILSEVIRG